MGKMGAIVSTKEEGAGFLPLPLINVVEFPKSGEQPEFQQEKGHGNDCACDQQICPLPLLIPIDHGFTHGEHRNGRIGEIYGEKIRLHAGDNPKRSSDTGDDKANLFCLGHGFL